MKFLCIGCIHGNIPKGLREAIKKNQVDAVLCCGDIANTDMLRDLAFASARIGIDLRVFIKPASYKKIMQDAVRSMQPVMKFFATLPVPVFLVLGNNDFTNREAKHVGMPGIETLARKNVTILNNRIVSVGDVSIAGLSLFRDKQAYDKKTEKKMNLFFKKIVRPENTILLTHDVPYHVFDKVLLRESPAYGKHVGEQAFNKLFAKKPVLAHICSHMHEYQDEHQLYRTTVINTGYGHAERWAIVETNDEAVQRITFNRGKKMGLV
ncbi:MAG: metallophosphoesterase [Candidatus Aenigmarchaeota archaeon]|nr:metallophosphoesterase [Candidatus Aenigmarchaeota archaeon]